MWTDRSVFYQIYPLGAFGCPFENDFQAKSRILRMKDWIPHLKKLGVDCILFNPVFESHTHGYDTIDYKKLDSRLGTNEDFASICRLLHENGIRVVLDGVFNHVGRGFFAFQDVLMNRENSSYKDWFYINFWENNNYDDHLSYQNWEGNNNLVKLNLQNYEVVQYLLDVISFWKNEFQIDGLRLDVAYCLDREFLKTLHRTCKEMDPSFFLLGETLHGDYNQWVNAEMLDSCTNYECYKGLYSSFNSANLFEILHSLHRQFGKDNWCLYRGKHLLSFVDNHDVDRIASQLVHKEHLSLIYTMLFTMPGIPCLYYGSEWGIEGKKNWNDTELRPKISQLEWNTLTDHIQKLILIKHEHDALHQCDYQQIYLTNTACIYQMKSEKETLWICINMNPDNVEVPIDYRGQANNLLTQSQVDINGVLYLEPNSSMILQI